MSAASLFAKGAALMASEQPDDWGKAWDRYLEPLERKYPDHPYQAEVGEFRQRYLEYRAEREAARPARWKPRLGEGQWFFEKGARLWRQGDEAGARRVWKALAEAFREVAAEKPWARRAEKALQEKRPGGDGEDLASLRQALKRAQTLQAQGRKEEAGLIRQALADLYRDDPAARELLKGQ
jgi:serine/threonine-protein kinase